MQRLYRGVFNLVKTTLSVSGMTCANCAKHITNALQAVPGVIRASADHKKGCVEIASDGPVDDAMMRLLKEAVTEAGYTPA